jgi:hypothetical protein
MFLLGDLEYEWSSYLFIWAAIKQKAWHAHKMTVKAGDDAELNSICLVLSILIKFGQISLFFPNVYELWTMYWLYKKFRNLSKVVNCESGTGSMHTSLGPLT